jgi:hypothetical protein
MGPVIVKSVNGIARPVELRAELTARRLRNPDRCVE